MSNRRRVLAATLAAAAGLCAATATATATSTSAASAHMQIGVYDEGETFFDNPTAVFALYKSLHVQVLRVNLYWGGKLGVAKARPFDGSDPRDAAYDWSLYDRTAARAPTGLRPATETCGRLPTLRRPDTAARTSGPTGERFPTSGSGRPGTSPTTRRSSAPST